MRTCGSFKPQHFSMSKRSPMRQREYLTFRNVSLALTATFLLLTVADSALAQPALERVIHRFTGGSDGAFLSAGLAADENGNLFGVFPGGPYCATESCGNVFELVPPATEEGEWTKIVIHTFKGGENDGAEPHGGLIFDKAGNLYGTTLLGGSSSYGCGTAFQLSPPSSPGAAWHERILFSFPCEVSVGGPLSSLIFDSRGNLYGVSPWGGPNQCLIPQNAGCGVVFELSPPTTHSGEWSETILHEFAYDNGDAFYPLGGLVADRTGALYGTTVLGGSHRHGSIYRLVRDHGVWSESIIYDFPGTQVGGPTSGLIVDGSGNLYGTAENLKHFKNSTLCPSTVECGEVFELSPPLVVGGSWTKKILHTFTGGRDGATPQGNLLIDKAGNLYGAAMLGGLKNSNTNNNGTIFKLSPPTEAGGDWTETTLHEFGGGTYNDGTWPLGGLIQVQGKFYGTTFQGGAPLGVWGTAFSLTILP
jgi:hypothetical protein